MEEQPRSEWNARNGPEESPLNGGYSTRPPSSGNLYDGEDEDGEGGEGAFLRANAMAGERRGGIVAWEVDW